MQAERIWGEGPGRRREVMRILTAGGVVRDQLELDLTEPDETVRILVAYVGRGADQLELDYRVNHLAPKTKSEIFVCGVLDGAARKELRMAIDFRRGCAGAIGEEREDAVVLSETVVSRAHPVIYCGEEDVLGTHGASTGRLDESAMAYLQARGLPELVARKLLIRARLWQIVGKISDEGERARAVQLLEQALQVF